ncbi:MAG: Hsp20 family protein [Polynucleobacter sp.]|nr:Hsp20 family protein [Polynucleobacter sp.]
MRTSDFTPLWRTTIGFDHLADLVDRTLHQATDDGYPPYNIERSNADAYRITIALAGFSADDVSVTAEQNTLTVEGSKATKDDRDYLYRGIAARPFRRIFNLADYVQVKQADLKDGLLTIDLVRELPEAMKPRRIAINGAPTQISQQKAA